MSNLTTVITKTLRGDRRVYFVTAFQSTNALTGVFAKNIIKWYLENRYLKDLNRIDGEPVEFEWKNLVRNHYVELLREDSKLMRDNDIVGENKETQKSVRKFSDSCELCSQILRVIGLSWPGSDKKWYWKTRRILGQNLRNEKMNFSEGRHPKIRATSALGGELRSKEKGKKSIDFNGSEENIELILRTVISVIKLGIYGSVADLCRELPKDSEIAGKHGNSNSTSYC